MGTKTKIARGRRRRPRRRPRRRRLRLRRRPQGRDRRRRHGRRRRRRRDDRRGSRSGGPPQPAARRCATRSRSPTRARRWTLPGEKLKIHADVSRRGRARPLAASQDGGLPGRLVRYVTGDEVDESIPAAGQLLAAGDQPLRPPRRRRARPRTGERLGQRRAPTSSKSSPPRTGRKLRDDRLTRELKAAVTDAAAPRTIVAAVHSTAPEVTTEEVAARVPVLPDPRPRQLHPAPLEGPEAGQDLHRRGRPGRAGNAGRPLRNPGQGRKPDLARAGIRLGRRPRRAVDPARPLEPDQGALDGDLRRRRHPRHRRNRARSARAASHGCVRMAIPDVEELYDQVEVGTPIYIG